MTIDLMKRVLTLCAERDERDAEALPVGSVSRSFNLGSSCGYRFALQLLAEYEATLAAGEVTSP